MKKMAEYIKIRRIALVLGNSELHVGGRRSVAGWVPCGEVLAGIVNQMRVSPKFFNPKRKSYQSFKDQHGSEHRVNDCKETE